jgi:integrase
MALSDIQIRNLQSSDKDQWITDEKGLRLLVKKNGSKYWRLKYRFQGIQKTLALGVYPTTTLKEARELCIDAKRDVAKGVDPGAKKQQEKHDSKINFDNSFEILAREWWEHQKGTWTEDHANRVWSRLKDNSFKVIGHLPVNDITPQVIISTIRVIEKRDALDVAQRVLQDIRRVCRYAVQTCRLLHNPASELSDILKSRKTSHRASLPLEELPKFMKALSTYEDTGRLLTKYALQLLILTFVRPGELRGARWDEFNFEDSMWRIPGKRMKMGTEHLVPLSKQALSVIQLLRPISGQYELLFPSERDRTRPMSDNTMRRAIFKLGYDGSKPGKTKANPHGFRATASSLLNEKGFNPDAIERQLSHMERNGVRAAYTHHARYLDERREMMQWWADIVMSVK